VQQRTGRQCLVVAQALSSPEERFHSGQVSPRCVRGFDKPTWWMAHKEDFHPRLSEGVRATAMAMDVEPGPRSGSRYPAPLSNAERMDFLLHFFQKHRRQKEGRAEPDQSKRTGASRLAQDRSERHRRLAPALTFGRLKYHRNRPHRTSVSTANGFISDF